MIPAIITSILFVALCVLTVVVGRRRQLQPVMAGYDFQPAEAMVEQRPVRQPREIVWRRDMRRVKTKHGERWRPCC